MANLSLRRKTASFESLARRGEGAFRNCQFSVGLRDYGSSRRSPRSKPVGNCNGSASRRMPFYQLSNSSEPVRLVARHGGQQNQILHTRLLYEDAQEDYCNEECDKGKQVMSLSCGLENECSESKLHAPAKVFQSSVPPKNHGKFLGSHFINWKKEEQTTTTRYLPISEALGLSSSTKCMKTTSSSRIVSTNHLNESMLDTDMLTPLKTFAKRTESSKKGKSVIDDEDAKYYHSRNKVRRCFKSEKKPSFAAFK
ncbi:uncharacterized protein LOC107865921 [Capsicum annuum]|uniref:uncharacterized protein LOC107865921 n=1 Tax=Capsicum annuum TaxID=4072 RepID=UPI001FB09A71|nr:uncharacterized protein LOC107865921 [Capsicum annuum]